MVPVKTQLFLISGPLSFFFSSAGTQLCHAGEVVRGAPGAINSRENRSAKETLLKSADRFSTHYHFLFSSGVSFSAQRGSRHASTPLLLSRHMGLCTSPHRLAPSERVSGCFFFLLAAATNKKEQRGDVPQTSPTPPKKSSQKNNEQ